jgi:serine/threonine protein kinase
LVYFFFSTIFVEHNAHAVQLGDASWKAYRDRPDGWAELDHHQMAHFIGKPTLKSIWIQYFTENQLNHLISDICATIQKIHDAEWIHGSTSPRNILMISNERKPQ